MVGREEKDTFNYRVEEIIKRNKEKIEADKEWEKLKRNKEDKGRKSMDNVSKYGFIAVALTIIVGAVLVTYNDHEFNTAYNQGLRDGSTEHNYSVQRKNF